MSYCTLKILRYSQSRSKMLLKRQMVEDSQFDKVGPREPTKPL